MSKELEIKWLEDGTPESLLYGDIYFSRENGLAESSYVFLGGNNLPTAWLGSELFSIAELGFGTGLNFLNTVKLWSENKKHSGILHYVAFEKHPLSAEEIKKALRVWPELADYSQELIDNLPEKISGFHRIVFKEIGVYLTLAYGDANILLEQFQGQIDAWYLDGFAPAKNPDLWSETIFKNIAAKSNPGASAATFSAARIVKDGLASAGFEVSLKKGFAKKRDMLIARLPGQLSKFSRQKKIAIIGAGLAGSLTACALSRRNYDCTVFEQSNSAANAASGAAAGVVMPYLVSKLDTRTEFFLNSFGFAWRQVNTSHSRCGVIRLANSNTQEKAFQNLASFNFTKDFAQTLQSDELSDLLKLKVNTAGFYFKSSGWINTKLYTEAGFVDSKLVLNTELAKFERKNNCFYLYDINNNFLGEFDKIVFANAFSAKKFFSNLPIKINRGQLIFVKTNTQLKLLKHVFCHDGYLLPESEGSHLVGASYDHHSVSMEQDLSQTQDLLNKLYKNLPELDPLEVCGYRVGLRTTTQSRLPIVDQIEPGVFVNVAHGSRGLVTCGIAGEIIAGMINGEPLPVGSDVLSQISSAISAVQPV